MNYLTARLHRSVVRTALYVVADTMHVRVVNFLIDSNNCNVVMWLVPHLYVFHVRTKVKTKVKCDWCDQATMAKSCHSQWFTCFASEDDYEDEDCTILMCFYISLLYSQK